VPRARGARAAGGSALALWLALLPGCGQDGSPETPSTPPPTASCGAGAPVAGTPALTTQQVARGLGDPVDLQAAPGDRSRVFVVEQAGRIRIIRDGALQGGAFLDIVSRVGSGGERGLLGLAFHPRYAENRRFFVNYTDRSGDTHIAEFRATANPDQADAGSERQLLFVRQPFANHNGGGLAFGNDGRLYIALGDGGAGGDPMGHGQNLGSHLGKILRVDVDGGQPYAVPSDNPFRATAGAQPEIWALGLRNPWRIAFDRATGDLYIGDVGQNVVEEIDVGLASRRGGENYGWNVTEGSVCFRPSSGCDRSGLTAPVLEYSHGDGCSVTGGFVYRGCRLPGYHGTYFYADYCSGLLRSFRLEGGRAVDHRDWRSALGRGLNDIVSFGVDGDGEGYIVDHDGEVYKIVPAS
jgi:glucose/arabinose dehydrogenase